MILAVVLSALVLLGWTWAANKWFPTSSSPSSKVENGKSQPLPQANGQPSAAAAPKATQSVSAVLGSTPRVRIASPSLQGSINLKGAQIDDLVLLRQRQTIEKDSPPVRLFSPLGTAGAYVASFGWTAQGGPAPDMNTVWTADSQQLTPGHPVTLSTETANGARYQIKIAVDDGYLFTVAQSVANATPQAFTVRPIGLVSRATQSADPTSRTMHVGPIGFFDGKANYSVD